MHSASLLAAVAVLLFEPNVANPTVFIETSYNHSFTPMEGYQFHWRFSGAGDARRIEFALVVDTALGWIGFGIGEPTSGSMPGADVMIATFDDAGQLTIEDRHTVAFRKPILDCDGLSDWRAEGWSRNSTTTVVEASRLLAVADTAYDRPIVDDGIAVARLIFAHGGDEPSLSYHQANRVKTSIQLFPADPSESAYAPTLQWLLDGGDVFNFTSLADNYVIPTQRTTYRNTACVKVPGPVDGKYPYLVAFEPVVVVNNARYVHHMVAAAFTTENCTGSDSEKTTIYGIASAHSPYVLPGNVGFYTDTLRSVNVAIHYDNIGPDVGVVDNSGIRVFYTYTPREHSAGILQLGDPWVQDRGNLVNPDSDNPIDGFSSYSYTCPSDCTNVWQTDYDTPNITVFGDMLHMHSYGVMMNTTFYSSSGADINRKAEYYNFHTQQNMLFEPFVFQAGDSIGTTCSYKDEDELEFGLGSDQEMCLHFVYYYPRVAGFAGSYCGYGSFFCGDKGVVRHGDVELEELGREYGPTCPAPMTPPPEFLPACPVIKVVFPGVGGVQAAGSPDGTTITLARNRNASVPGIAVYDIATGVVTELDLLDDDETISADVGRLRVTYFASGRCAVTWTENWGGIDSFQTSWTVVDLDGTSMFGRAVVHEANLEGSQKLIGSSVLGPLLVTVVFDDTTTPGALDTWAYTHNEYGMLYKNERIGSRTTGCADLGGSATIGNRLAQFGCSAGLIECMFLDLEIVNGVPTLTHVSSVQVDAPGFQHVSGAFKGDGSKFFLIYSNGSHVIGATTLVSSGLLLGSAFAMNTDPGADIKFPSVAVKDDLVVASWVSGSSLYSRALVLNSDTTTAGGAAAPVDSAERLVTTGVEPNEALESRPVIINSTDTFFPVRSVAAAGYVARCPTATDSAPAE
ncbi:Tyramine beta-hydroxylase [Diplonema papillatum]|nr:Tyramine beta-hydroxylase [Diplonema papillatum]